MQYQLSKLKARVQLLELTSQHLEKKAYERELLNAIIPSLDPVHKLYHDLDEATRQLQEMVKKSEDMRYECLLSGNPENCQHYWGLEEHIREQMLSNYTEFYWYVHSVESALNYRETSIPAIASSISRLQVKINHIQNSINIALSELSERSGADATENYDAFTNFIYSQYLLTLSKYNFSLPSSIVDRLLWYINPESTRLVSKELAEQYNLTINHLNTAFTNVSAKLSRVNIHRKWFKPGLFGKKNFKLVSLFMYLLVVGHLGNKQTYTHNYDKL